MIRTLDCGLSKAAISLGIAVPADVPSVGFRVRGSPRVNDDLDHELMSDAGSDIALLADRSIGCGVQRRMSVYMGRCRHARPRPVAGAGAHASARRSVQPRIDLLPSRTPHASLRFQACNPTSRGVFDDRRL
jgi:hypothetical protein